ncbi:hypothetical protein EGR_10433 [Echinococcus granulosus]|uniref:Uncharacterized protein n=1 Tax=Echinococcus granulosus TaxID=6210 RepID=W6UMJ3_ECHGR|nr:hypothetical protein EGR_10433 [Echinococcus granulosus]EUB54714.1 hypothetical protein EGR_10433 [Echinococcus granulosus]
MTAHTYTNGKSRLTWRSTGPQDDSNNFAVGPDIPPLDNNTALRPTLPPQPKLP